MSQKASFVLLVAVTLALGRIYLGYTTTPEPVTTVAVFKDFAHLFVGGLFVAWWLTKQNYLWYTFLGLCIVEIVVATLQRI